MVGWSSKKRAPAFGPRLTTRRAWPSGRLSAPAVEVSVLDAAEFYISLSRSARKTEVVSTCGSGVPVFSAIMFTSEVLGKVVDIDLLIS